jgi:1-phosphatidylinositol-3-phosphate 5-kinase
MSFTEFTDDTTKFFCKIYYAEEFRKLRETIYPNGEER